MWSLLVGSGAISIAAVALGAAAVVAAIVWGSAETPPTEDPRIELWGLLTLLAGLLILVLGVLAIGERDARRKYGRGDRKEHLKRLTKALNEGLTAVDAIRAETEQGNRELDEIGRRTEASNILAQLSDNQASAVKYFVRGEFSAFGRTSLRRDLAIAAVGAAVGAALGVVVPRLFA